MLLSNRRYDEIKDCVINLFRKQNINKIPVDCFEIIDKLNIILRPYSQLNELGRAKAYEVSKDGFCMLAEDLINNVVVVQWYIFYNDNQPMERIRFTLMHEIGHIVLNHKEGSDIAEAEANFFAKYALAPPPLVDMVKPEDYIELGRVFHISNQCALYAFRYYEKWLHNGNIYYEARELSLIKHFNLSYEKQ